MKVEHTNVDKLLQNRSDAANAVERSKQQAVEGSLDSRRKDEAALSDKAQALSSARTQFEEVPEVREDRVQALKEKIQAGEYDTDVNRLAGRIYDILDLD